MVRTLSFGKVTLREKTKTNMVKSTTEFARLIIHRSDAHLTDVYSLRIGTGCFVAKRGLLLLRRYGDLF